MPQSLHDAAIAYAKAGWPIFALQPNSKIPFEGSNGYKDATCDLELINSWWRNHPEANIGFCPENLGMCVVDEDVSKGGKYECDMVPTIVSTPNGRHHYYSGSLLPTVSKLARGVDTRGIGSYVLLPPSMVDGSVYHWLSDWPFNEWDLEPVPQWVVDKCSSTIEHRTADPDYPEDKPVAIEAFKRYLKRHPIPPEGEGSDHATYKAIARGRDLGLSDQRIVEMLDATGFDEEYLWEKLSNVEKYQQNDPGSDIPLTSAEKFSTFAENTAPNLRTQDIFLDSYEELQLGEPEPIVELIPGLIEKYCVNYLAGIGGTNKSRIAQHMGVCLHTGTPLYGRDVEQAVFVHISYENGRDEDRRRRHTIVRRLELDPVQLHGSPYQDFQGQEPLLLVSEDGDLQPTELWSAIVTYLNGIAGHKFIVFDSAYNVLGFLGQAKINETAVKRAVGWMDWQMRCLNATGLMIQHPSYAGMQRGDNSGGSPAWVNAPRVRLALKPIDDMPGGVELSVKKRNNGPLGKPIQLFWSDGLMLPNDTFKEQRAIYLACVAEAKRAANGGWPLKRGATAAQTGITLEHREAIESECGFMLGAKRIIEQLNKAVSRGDLTYQPYNDNAHGNDRLAGYKPSDKEPEEPNLEF